MDEEKTQVQAEELTPDELAAKKRKKKIQIISLVALFGVLVLGTVLAIPLIKTLTGEGGMEKMRDILKQYNGVVSIFIFVFIQALQVILAVIPPIQVVGGLLYGWFWGGILSFLGTFIGTALIFVIVAKFGKPVVEAFVDEKSMKKFSFLQDEKKLVGVLMILYVIPGTPKDVISYIVPLTPVKKKDFFCLVMPCRIPAILLSTIMGSNAGNGNFKIVGIVIAVAVVLAVLGFMFKDTIVEKLKHRKNDED